MGDHQPSKKTCGVSRRLVNGRMSDEYYKPFPPNHFAPKAGDQKLDIAIVGAGIAGLLAAIALLQAGHNVELYERSKFANEIGAAITMTPNAARILSHYEFDFACSMATSMEAFKMVNGRDLRPLSHEPLPDFEAQFGYPWYIFHRVDLHSELKRMVSEPRPNTSAVAKIHLLSEVADIDLDGNMTLVTGETLKKDLIVVADGIRSALVSMVVGNDESVRIVPTGQAVYRFLIPTETLHEDEQTRDLYKDDKFTMYIAPAEDVRLIWYPCRGGTLQNNVLFHPDEIEGYENEGAQILEKAYQSVDDRPPFAFLAVWNIPASYETFMETCKKLHPGLQAACAKAEDLKLWRMCERENPIPTLTNGKVAVIGDAAHPMLPHQGQGAAMAVEDGAALGVLFSGLRSKDDVPDRLKLFQGLRWKRVSRMQIFSSVGQDEAAKIADRVRPYVEAPPPRNHNEYYEHNFTPNILRDAVELLETHRAGADGNIAE